MTIVEQKQQGKQTKRHSRMILKNYSVAIARTWSEDCSIYCNRSSVGVSPMSIVTKLRSSRATWSSLQDEFIWSCEKSVICLGYVNEGRVRSPHCDTLFAFTCQTSFDHQHRLSTRNVPDIRQLSGVSVSGVSGHFFTIRIAGYPSYPAG